MANDQDHKTNGEQVICKVLLKEFFLSPVSKEGIHSLKQLILLGLDPNALKNIIKKDLHASLNSTSQQDEKLKPDNKKFKQGGSSE